MKKTKNVQYSEIEAAGLLGLSVEQLRSLVQDQLGTGDDPSPEPMVANFRAADIVVLRILAGKPCAADVASA